MDAGPAINPLALPEVSRAEFDEIFERLKRWGHYREPSRGAWGAVGPDKVREAAGLVARLSSSTFVAVPRTRTRLGRALLRRVRVSSSARPWVARSCATK